MNIIHEDDDDQDIYISERSSIDSSIDLHRTSTVPDPTPILTRPLVTTPLPFHVQQTVSHSKRHEQHDSNDNGHVHRTQIQVKGNDEKIKMKNRKKPPIVSGGAMPFSENKSNESRHHQHSYGIYHRVKYPDRLKHNRPFADSQVRSYDSFDNFPTLAQTTLIASSIKPIQAVRKARRDGPTTKQSVHEKSHVDSMEKTLPPFSSIHADNDHQLQSTIKPASRLSFFGRDNENDAHCDVTNERQMPLTRRKSKVNNERIDHHVQPVSNKFTSQESNTHATTSHSVITRSNKRSKPLDRHAGKFDSDDNTKSRYYANHPPSIPSSLNHQQLRRRSPSGAFPASELPVVEISCKKYERLSQQPISRDSYHHSPSPPPSLSVGNHTSYLPPIIRDNHSKPHIGRFPHEYYGTLARQTHANDWDESMEISNMYRPEPQARCYDRFLTIGPDKRLFA
jgi:hypothetical protein